MSKINFYSNQKANTDQINKISENYVSDIDKILSTIINDGIVVNYPDVTAEFNLTQTDALHYSVGFGKAVINGKYIEIAANQNYNPAHKDEKPYVNSGNIDITAYAGLNGDLAVFIRPLYIQDSTFKNYDVSGNIVYTQDLDGYEITTNPPDIITDDCVYIGKITISGGAITAISNDIANRTYRKINFDKLYIDPTALDVGPQFANFIGKLFDNGIVSDRENVLAMQINADFKSLEIPLSRTLQGNEAILINGYRLSSSNNIDYSIGILDDTGTLRADGTYNIYYNSLGKLVALLDTQTVDTTQYLLIAKALLQGGLWYNPDNQALLYPKDMRQVGIVSNNKLQDVVLRNLTKSPLGINLINYLNGSLGITITYFDPNDEIDTFVIEGYNDTTEAWEQVATINNIK